MIPEEVDHYLQRIDKRIEKYTKRLEEYKVKESQGILSGHGYWSKGYQEGLLCILEELKDLRDEYYNKA